MTMDRPEAFAAFRVALELYRVPESVAVAAFNLAWHAGEASGVELGRRMPRTEEHA